MTEPVRRADHQLFIADLHLQPSAPATFALAREFVAGAAGVGALWILGDLFDHWIGDDDDASWLQPLLQDLKALSRTGTAIHLMHGNRDFLIGERLAKAMGAVLHRQDSLVIELGTRPVLLMHGDTLCTDDLDYQRWRTMSRGAEWQHDFLARPLAERRQIASSLRTESRNAGADKSASITDVSEPTVIAAMHEARCDLLIHGHTHRPNLHEVDAVPGQRIVVGDWQPEQARVARWNGRDISLEWVRPASSGDIPPPSPESRPSRQA